MKSTFEKKPIEVIRKFSIASFDSFTSDERSNAISKLRYGFKLPNLNRKLE
jgi:hypothetical protein